MLEAYRHHRIIQVHRSHTQEILPHNGLLAGCGFAVHAMKAYLLPLEEALQGVGHHPRTYVDDIVVTTYGQTCSQTIKEFHAGYDYTHAWLREVGMSPNPDKEEILASSAILQRAVADLCPPLPPKPNLSFAI
jgi:hypothetical protein